MALKEVKMEVGASQKLAEEEEDFRIMAHGCRLLSFHEYCIFLTFTVDTVLPG